MKEKMIKIVKIEVGKAPYQKEIANELEALQKEVDGLIECVYLDDGAIAVINEEGKINGMQPNRRIGSDIICGPFFICGDTRDGNFASLSEKEIEKYSQIFKAVPEFKGDEPELEPRITIMGFDMFGGM